MEVVQGFKDDKISIMSVIEWVNTWQTTYKKPFIKDYTYKELCRYTRYIKCSRLGELPLNQVKSGDIQRFLNSYPKSRKKELLSTYLRAIFEKAYNLEYIERNPAKGLTLDKKIKSIRYSLNLEQQKALLKAVKDTNIEEIVLFYLLTGVRRNEALWVKFSDLDIKNGIVHIDGTKTANAVRDIPLTKKYIKRLQKFDDGRAYIFNFNPDYVTKKIHKIFKQLEIPACLHCLRHTFSTNQMYLGTPDKFRQEWLGHATTQMTNEVYTHIDKSLTKRNIQRLYKKMYYFERV